MTDRLKEKARELITDNAEALLSLSHRIHDSPELGFQEHQAVGWVAQELRNFGLAPEVGAYGLETALECRTGESGPTVAICAEYDALPGIGHACGHNVIAAAAVGATLALSRVAAELPLRVRLLGTPAEEVGDGAGKTLLLERGAFDDLTAALMVHPAPHDVIRPTMIAGAALDVEFRGRASHAAFYPELGINAADAMTISQVAIGLLRQHILASDRIHGIVTSAGEAPNIVPARAQGRYLVRARRLSDLAPLVERVRLCFEAGAQATGCSVSLTGGDRPYADVVHDAALSAAYEANAARLGRIPQPDDERPSGSTDMGNVSQVLPSIHPFIGIGSWPAVNHQPEFTECAASSQADRAVLDGAILLAWTAIDHVRAQ